MGRMSKVNQCSSILEYRTCESLRKYVLMADGSLCPVELLAELVRMEQQKVSIAGVAEG